MCIFRISVDKGIQSLRDDSAEKESESSFSFNFFCRVCLKKTKNPLTLWSLLVLDQSFPLRLPMLFSRFWRNSWRQRSREEWLQQWSRCMALKFWKSQHQISGITVFRYYNVPKYHQISLKKIISYCRSSTLCASDSKIPQNSLRVRCSSSSDATPKLAQPLGRQ